MPDEYDPRYARRWHNHDDRYVGRHAYTEAQETQDGRLDDLEDRVAAAQADSAATDVPGIVSDFNALLAKLRAAGLMDP